VTDVPELRKTFITTNQRLTKPEVALLEQLTATEFTYLQNDHYN